MNIEDKRKINALGIVLASLAFFFVVLSLGLLPASYIKSDFFQLFKRAYNTKDYYSVVLFILVTLVNVLEPSVIFIWAVYIFVRKKDFAKFPVILSIAYLVIKFGYTILVNYTRSRLYTNSEMLEYLCYIGFIVSWVALLVKRHLVTRIVFLVVGIIALCRNIPNMVVIIKHLNLINIAEIRKIGSFSFNFVYFVLGLIVFSLFIVFVFEPDLFQKKVSEKNNPELKGEK